MHLSRNFDRAATAYLEHAQLQKNTASELLACLNSYPAKGLVLDLGSGPGTFKHESLQRNLAVVNCDLSLKMLKVGHTQQLTSSVCATATSLPFAKNSFDLVISNLMVQWPANKDALFAEIQRVLKNNGVVMFTTLIKPSLWQLQQAFRSVDNQQHSLEFRSLADYFALCNNNALSIVEHKQWEYCCQFINIKQLLWHFKLTGTSLPRPALSQGLAGKHLLEQLSQAYPIKTSTGSYPLSYYCLLIIARKQDG